MILSNADIRKALKDGTLVIEPLPGEDQIDTTSIDLRIGDSLWVWDEAKTRKNGEAVRVDVDAMDYRDLSDRYLLKVEKDPAGKFVIHPKTVYLASTFEKVMLPMGSRLAARVEGKSSLARLGLAVHITAPTIHCGTGLGIITLEMINHGPFPIEVRPGVSRIAQLILEQVLTEPEDRPDRTFTAQKTPKG